MKKLLYTIGIPVGVFLLWCVSQLIGWAIVQAHIYFDSPEWVARFVSDVMGVVGIILICIVVVRIFRGKK